MSRILFGCGLIAVLAYAVVKWTDRSTHPSDQTLSAVVARGDFLIYVTERGELESVNPTTITCEVEGGGKLASIIPEGSRVKKGDEVARLDTDVLQKAVSEQEVKVEQAIGKVKSSKNDLEVQLNKSQSEIDKAKLKLTLAKLDVEAYKEGEFQVELDKRKGALENARKEMKEAEDELEFTKKLIKSGQAQLKQAEIKDNVASSKRYAVKQMELDLMVFEKYSKRRKLTELEANALDAARELDRTEKSMKAAEDKCRGELKAAENTSDLEQKQMERLRKQVGKCVISAPQDGIIVYAKNDWEDQSQIKPGGTVYFQQQIIKIPDLDRMQVKVLVHESVVKKVVKDLSATMQIDALANTVLHGKVRSVATMAKSQWGSQGVKEYQTLVSIEDLPHDVGLRPGMTSEVKILLKSIKDAVTVPIASVTEVEGQHVCYVKTGSGFEKREIKVGDSNEKYIQILEGVVEGEQVALDARSRAVAELKKTSGSALKAASPK